MSCNCEVQFKRLLPAANKFSIHLTADRKGAPVQWLEDNLAVCIQCGEIVAAVPEDVLQILQESAGEPVA